LSECELYFRFGEGTSQSHEPTPRQSHEPRPRAKTTSQDHEPRPRAKTTSQDHDPPISRGPRIPDPKTTVVERSAGALQVSVGEGEVVPPVDLGNIVRARAAVIANRTARGLTEHGRLGGSLEAAATE
jgi:hypothetical protein